MHQHEPKDIREPIANHHARLKQWLMQAADQPAKANRQRNVHESIVPPRERRQNESDHAQNTPLHQMLLHSGPHSHRRKELALVGTNRILSGLPITSRILMAIFPTPNLKNLCYLDAGPDFRAEGEKDL